MIRFIKRWLKQRTLEKYRRMDSEIRCSIIYNVLKEQEKQIFRLPVFMEVEQRYRDLNITTPKDLKRVYTQLFFKGEVSGVEL